MAVKIGIISDTHGLLRPEAERCLTAHGERNEIAFISFAMAAGMVGRGTELESPMNEGDEKNDRIKARAHKIWESEGRPEGQQEHHWERAELEIMREDAKAD